jgi:hypothetical protein
MAFSLLPALRPRDWHSTICVRVCRKWEYRGGTDDGPIQHVDLVLVDEQVRLSVSAEILLLLAKHDTTNLCAICSLCLLKHFK